MRIPPRRFFCARICYKRRVLFAESHARLLLLVHTALGVATVAAATHLAVWMRDIRHGRFRRIRAIKRFARISACLYVLTLLAGNIIYPVYKIRVRVEYLEQPDAIVKDQERRRQMRARIAEEYWAHRHRQAPSAESPGASAASAPGTGSSASAEVGVPASAHLDSAADLASVDTAAKLARWFDVKEHWVALGSMLAVACAICLHYWPRQDHGAAIRSIAYLMAVGAAACAWLAAVIGVLVSGVRAVG